MAAFLDAVWSELIWLIEPDPSKDTQIRNVAGGNLLYSFPMAVGVLSIRYILYRYCFQPLGQYLGVKDKRARMAPANQVLEEVYLKWKKVPHSEIVGLAKHTDMSERQIERWLRQRKKQDRPSTLVKFCECCWRLTYYFCIFVYGVLVLWDKPWLWDITQSWADYPDAQIVSRGLWWYYMIALAFYVSLFFSQFFDVKRKDFWQMLVHHVAAICLIAFSWLAGACRVGSLVLVVHDCGDIFLEAAKIAKYANYQLTCTICFCVFAVVWIVTRLGVFPLWIIKHTLVDTPRLAPAFNAYYIVNGMLITLEVLHIYWTYLILKIAAQAAGEGTVEKDVRSSSDVETEEN